MKAKEFIKEDQERSPDYYKRKANQYWRLAQQASMRGDGETSERMYDLGNLFNKRYKKALRQSGLE